MIDAHFILENRVWAYRTIYQVPRIGEEVRFGGEGKETFYTVYYICWPFDENTGPTGNQRVNIGIESLQEMK